MSIGKFVLLAYLLTFIMEIVSVCVGFYVDATGMSIDELSSNKVLIIVQLIGEITLPIFLLNFYKEKITELDIVMPFSKKDKLSKYFLGYTLGLLLFLIIWSVSVYLSGFHVVNVWSMSNIGLLLLFFLGYGFQGMAEEIVCRGYLQGRLMQITNPKVAIVISALFFSFLHGANDGITLTALVSLFLFGIFTGIIRYYTNDLWAVGAFHSAWNFIQGPVLGVSVSGSDNQALILQSNVIPNKDFVNGGSFGLEGSGLTVLAYLVVIILTIILNTKIFSEKE